jgi:hypothetical protein
VGIENTATAVMALVVAALVYRHWGFGKWSTKILILLTLFASANLTGGWFGRFTHWAADTLQTGSDKLTHGLFGVVAPAALILVAAATVTLDLAAGIVPKMPSTMTRYGVAAALVLPVLLTSQSAGAAGPLGDWTRSGLETANRATGGVIGATFDSKAYQSDADADDKAGRQQGGQPPPEPQPMPRIQQQPAGGR